MSPLHQCCYVCGVVVGAKHFDETDWAGLPVYNTELIISQRILDWSSDFRAIIFDRSQQKQPFLSGVGRINNGFDDPSSPCNRAAHYNDDPPPETVEFHGIHPCGDSTQYAPVYGCLIHSYCWKFLEQRLGPIPDGQLLTLSNVLKVRWDDEDFGGAKSFVGFQWGGGSHSSNSATSATFVSDPWNIPEVNTMIKRCLKQGKKRKRSIDGTQKTNGSKYIRFPKELPQELKYLILDYLEFKDVRRALAAFGWVVQESYCRSRFRSDLFFEIQEYSIPLVDWHVLWRESESFLEMGSCCGLENRKRIFKIVKSIQSEFDQYRRLYDTNPGKNTLADWSVVFKSTKADELSNVIQTIKIPAATQQIHFSFIRKGSVDDILSGIEISPGSLTLGYVNSISPISRVVNITSPIHGCLVKLDQKGIRDINLIHKEGSSGWITGFGSVDSSVGVLFHNEGEETLIGGMMDAHQLTAIGSITKGQRGPSCGHKSHVHRCLRSSGLWRPDVPPSIVDLNEDKYTENGPDRPIIENRTRPILYQPLRYTLFGGIHGERIGSLRSIKGYKENLSWSGPCGLEFIYQKHDSLVWGSRGERMWSIDLDKGEYIEKIQVDDLRVSPKPMMLTFITNLGQALTFGSRDNTFETRTSYLTAGVGEMIVGFYSGSFNFLQFPNPNQSAEDFAGFGIITVPLPS